MKPHVTLHMGISIDGRIVPRSWPENLSTAMNAVYEQIHQDLAGDAWIVGRVTMAEFGKGAPRPAKADARIARTTWKADGALTGPYAIAIDQAGKLHLNIDRANDDSIVVVLTEAVADDHLAELQRDGISYLFAGTEELDFALALDRLGSDFGIKRLLLEGGGGINGSFLSAGLIDAVSLLVCPVADGGDGPTLFSSGPLAAARLQLDGAKTLADGFVHLTYTVLPR